MPSKYTKTISAGLYKREKGPNASWWKQEVARQ